MGRINVLFIGRDQKTSASCRKIVARHIRDLAFFEVESKEEASRLLSRFNIHLVLSDHSSNKKELSVLKNKFPEVPILKTGSAEDQSGEGIIHIPEADLKQSLKSFLKKFRTITGSLSGPEKKHGPESFADYSSLLSGQ